MPTDVFPILAVVLPVLFVLAIAWALRGPPRAKRFSCPKCGSTSWGSVPPFTEGACAGCAFRWSRKNDATYFHAP